MHQRATVFRLWALLLLLFGLVGPAAAQRGGDDGEYQIMQAHYGTPRHHVDVTQRLKELARQDRSFRMGNDTFGIDPAPNQVKTLRIYARGRDGQTRIFDYAEGHVVDGSRFTGWGGGKWGQGGWSGGWGDNNNQGSGNQGGRDDDGEYQILQARYGTPRHHVDVTQRLKELARRDRRVRMGNDTFGTDPDPGRVKTLRIFARDRSGQTRTFEYTEGSLVDGSQFTGWGGGNWGQGGWGGGWGDSGGTAGGAGRLNIVSATYGIGSRQLDVTQRLRSRIRDGRIDLKVDNGIAGYDPVPDRRKNLVVRFTVDGGPMQTRHVTEDNRLSIP